MLYILRKHACSRKHEGREPASHSGSVRPLCHCVWSTARLFFFVCLIKADVVQSRGLRGEIKVLLPPRFGGGGKVITAKLKGTTIKACHRRTLAIHQNDPTARLLLIKL